MCIGTATCSLRRAWQRDHGAFGGATAIAAILLLACAAAANAATFTVNNTLDALDVNPGDGICAAGPGDNACTLRAAVQEANTLNGSDAIVLPAGTFYLARVGYGDLEGDLNLLDNVTITGAGPALTIIDGNSSATHERVFAIAKCKGGLVLTCDAQNPPVSVSISGVAIEHGFSNDGGGILNSGSLLLSNCLVTENSVSSKYGSGGGIASFGALAVSNCTISNNQASASEFAYGAGIYTTGPATIDRTIISGNAIVDSAGYGGGIYGSDANPVITDSTISGNTAMDGGGVAGSVDMTSSTVSGNTATGSGGGAALFLGFSTLVNSTISGNHSYQNGAGIYASGTVTTLLHHTTITLNSANDDERGSAIAAGVYNASSGDFYSYNSIIAQNKVLVVMLPKNTSVTDDCAGVITSVGKTIFGKVDATHCTVAGDVNDVTVGDPKLGSLQMNGGPTPTHALLAGSPAIDAGPDAACVSDFTGTPLTVDQRGVARPAGAHCDVGAFELQADKIFENGFQL